MAPKTRATPEEVVEQLKAQGRVVVNPVMRKTRAAGRRAREAAVQDLVDGVVRGAEK